MAGYVDRYFKVAERGSTFGTEVRAGVATFLTCSYILLVNPVILSQGGLKAATVVSATATTSALASMMIGLLGNLPMPIIPGMGLNAFFVFSEIKEQKVSIEVALAACAVAAALVAALAVIRLLGVILKLVPDSIKLAVIVGMGMLLSFIGLKSAGIVVANSETLCGLGDITSTEAIIATFGLGVIASLQHHNVKGSILVGIVLVSVVYFAVKQQWPSKVFSLPEFRIWAPDFTAILAGNPSQLSAVVSYSLVMIFDIGGAMFGLGNLAGIVEDGSVPGGMFAFLAAASGSLLGAFMGSTPMIIAAESAVGIKEGGRTGLTAITTGLCFLAALFFAPLLQKVPAAATAPVLVLVGVMMMGESSHIGWGQMTTAVPAFLTIVMQPFTFSISHGIYAGVLFALLLFFLTGDFIKVLMELWRKPEAGDSEGLEELLLDGRGRSVPGSSITAAVLIAGLKSSAYFKAPPSFGTSYQEAFLQRPGGNRTVTSHEVSDL